MSGPSPPISWPSSAARENDRWQKDGAANTPLALQLKVDFELVSHEVEFEEPYRTQIREGRLPEQEWRTALRERNNIATEYRIELRVRKDAPQPVVGPSATAYLFEPDWTDPAWKVPVQAYLQAFAPGDPVAMVIPLREGESLPEIQGKIVAAVEASGRAVFPDIVLVGPDESLMDTLRGFPTIHWVPKLERDFTSLPGAFGRLLAHLRQGAGSS